jgi:hypothetical protein
MIDRSSQIINPIADDSWAVDCLPLMPTFRARVQREQEARRRAEQERAEEANRAAAEERRLYFEKQQNAAKLEREKQQKLRKQETDRARAARANENRTLSPTSSRAVAKRKSGSSIGGSGSGGEVEKMVAPKGSQRKGSRKGKGKEPKDVGSMDPSELRDPPELPAGSFSVSKILRPLSCCADCILPKASHSCDRCATLETPFRCFITVKSRQCVKCKHDKTKCVFRGADAKTQIAQLTGEPTVEPPVEQAGPLTPRPRQPQAPVPSGSQRPNRPSPGKFAIAFWSILPIGDFLFQSKFVKRSLLLPTHTA